MDAHDTPRHYRKPGWLTRHVLNPTVAGMARLGISISGSRVLEVRGRTTGEPRRTPVNLLTFHDGLYLVSPRGETQWVRNLRADDGRVALLLGRQRRRYLASELVGNEKVPVLRAYLQRWKAEVGVFFDGVGPDSSDEAIAAIAPRHPVFSLAEV